MEVVVPDDDTEQIDTAVVVGLLDEGVKLIGLTWIPTSTEPGAVPSLHQVELQVRTGSLPGM